MKASCDRIAFGSWASVVRFKHRYAMVNQLIANSKTHNLLELLSELTKLSLGPTEPNEVIVSGEKAAIFRKWLDR